MDYEKLVEEQERLRLRQIELEKLRVKQQMNNFKGHVIKKPDLTIYNNKNSSFSNQTTNSSVDKNGDIVISSRAAIAQSDNGQPSQINLTIFLKNDNPDQKQPLLPNGSIKRNSLMLKPNGFNKINKFYDSNPNRNNINVIKANSDFPPNHHNGYDMFDDNDNFDSYEDNYEPDPTSPYINQDYKRYLNGSTTHNYPAIYHQAYNNSRNTNPNNNLNYPNYKQDTKKVYMNENFTKSEFTNQKDYYSQAAIKIQSHFRGYRERKMLYNRQNDVYE